jgi:hypothetical protein
MCEQQIIYFIFLAACYIVILILQTYFKQEKDALHNKNILYYIWYRLLLTIKVCFFFGQHYTDPQEFSLMMLN